MFRTFLMAATTVSMLTFAPPSMSAANAANIFDKLAGSWRGSGIITPSIDSDEETIRCRMKNNNDKDPNKLVLSGSCGVGGFRFSLRGWIQKNGNKNSYTASMFQSLASLKTETFAGKTSGNKLNLVYKGFDKLSKQTISARLAVVSRGVEKFEVQVSRTDPESGKLFKVGTIKFAKK